MRRARKLSASSVRVTDPSAKAGRAMRRGRKLSASSVAVTDPSGSPVLSSLVATVSV